MPKPENPGSQGKGKSKKRGSSVEKWTAKGYLSVILRAGETEVEEIALNPSTQSIVLAGHMFDEDGKRLKGSKPRLTITESATGAIIEARNPVQEDVTILYKIVSDVGDDEDDGEDEPPVLV